MSHMSTRHRQDSARKQTLLRVAEHGRSLLVIFPQCRSGNPVRLYHRLQKLERTAHDAAESFVKGRISEPEYDTIRAGVLQALDHILHFTGVCPVPVFASSDWRGYALKISAGWMHGDWRRSHVPSFVQDSGGYGILAPDFA